MTGSPNDLLLFRADVRNSTGLSAVEVGIPGDGAHRKTGGYHEGADVLRQIGRYNAPPTDHVGSSTQDYSARLLRDRKGLTLDASAVDIGDNWPRGGRSAWLRYNQALYAEMRDHPERLPALRAINVSLDGTTKRRYDQQHRGDGLIASTDTVTTHTHHEFYRDTAGQRAATLNRMVELIQAAIGGYDRTESAATAPFGDDDMFLYRAGADKAVYVADHRGHKYNINQELLDFLKAHGMPYYDGINPAYADILTTFGVEAPAVISDAQIDAIAQKLIASNANGLTAADHAGIVTDLRSVFADASA